MSTDYNSTIAFLRLPLTLLVVFIHVPFNSSDEFSVIFHKFWIEGICSIAVPAFFFISGFLFFTKEFSWKTYGSKLKRRIRTLLVPYLAWNLIALLVVMIPHFNDYDFSIQNVLAVFVNTKYSFLHTEGSSPIDYPLWYIRDLMICCILSPLFYTIRKLNILIPVIFWILWTCEVSLPVGTSSISICFFTLGGVIRVYGFPFKNHAFGYLAVSLLLMSIYIISGLDLSLHNIVMLILVLSLLPIGGFFLHNQFCNCFLLYVDIAFVIYAFHAIFVKKIYNIFIYFELSDCAAYILTYILTIMLCAIFNIILRETSPQIYSILTGKRINPNK